jgi:16S rRNA (guanine527-N7)-methyltransferase
MTAHGPMVEPLPAASSIFGANLDKAVHYAGLLATDGVERGLIGPREPERLWTRHLLNCAVVAELFPQGARVVDVGSGAGLPGLVLALVRPDLRLDLVEPLARRAQFLSEAIEALELDDRVAVHRGRAEEPSVISAVGETQWVTARAVAPLDRLVGWCLPLLAGGGQLAALKGATAEAEINDHRQAIKRARGINPRVVECGAGVVDPPVSVVLVERAPKPVS